MDRILKGTAATIAATFYVDGTGTNPTPDAATIRITRADGTDLVPAGTAATDDVAGRFTYQLAPSQTATLDTLTVEWATTNLGTITTIVEIAGGFLFSIADARALKPLDNTVTYTTATIQAMRTLVEQAIEDACGVAFVPRHARETLNGTGGRHVMLSHPLVQRVRTATNGTTTMAASDLAARPSGLMYSLTGSFGYGYGNVAVEYEHGYQYAPERVKRAAIRLARRWLVEGPVDDRATSMSTDDGTFALMTPGMRGMLFDLPEVQAVVDQYSIRPMVA